MDILDTLEDLELDDEELEDFLEVDEDSLALDLENYEMNAEEAEEITEAIRSSVTATYILIARAHSQKAHIALGYNTWEEYVNEEFDISASRSYQLLNMNKVVEEIEEVTPEGTEVKLTEAQARDIKRELPRITERIEEETRELPPEEAAEAVKRVVEEERADSKAEEKAKKAKEEELEEARDEARKEALEDVADEILEADKPNALSDTADTDMVEVEVEGDGEGMTYQTIANLQNLVNALDSIATLPPADDFVKEIPESRREDVNEKMLVASAYLNRFQTVAELEWDEEEE